MALVALATPVLVALFGALSHRSTWELQTGDEAVLEARLLTLWDPPALVGPYSRHEWHHPGPLLLWLLGVPYHLLGRVPLVLPLVMLATATAALASIVRSVFRLAPTPVSRAFGLVFVAVLLAEVSATAWPTGLSATWNPVCTLLPYVAFTLLCAELACGRWRVLPWVLLLHAFVAQTHVAYVLPASIALALASALAWRAARPRTRRDHRAVAMGSGVLLAAWSPVAYDQLFESGNLGWLVSFFVRGESPESPPSATTVALLFAWRTTEALRGALTPWGNVADASGTIGEASTGPLALAAVFVGGVVTILSRVAFGGGDAGAEARALARVSLVQLAVGGLSLRRIDNIDFPYLTWWLSVLGTTAAFAVGTLLLRRAWSPRAERAARAVMLVAVVLIVSRTSLEIVQYTRLAEERARRDQRALASYLAVLEQVYARAPEVRLDVSEHDLWGVLGASLVHLGRRDVRGHVDPRWIFMFGPGYRPSNEARELEIAVGSDHRCRDVGGGEIHLVDCASEGEVWVAAEPSPVSLSPSRSFGTRGELAWLVDGAHPPAGAFWDAPGSVIFDGTAAQVTLDVPVARLTRLVVHSDDNDVLVVSASADGERFESLVDVLPTHRFGQHAHEVALPGVVARFLRIAPRSGDGLYAISEIRAEGVLETVRVLDARGASGPLERLTDGVVPPLGSAWDHPTALRFEGPSPMLTIELPAIPVEGVTLVADHNETFRVELSFDGVRFEEFGTVPAGPGPGLRARSVYFDRDRAPSLVRFTVIEGDGAASVAEIVPRIRARSSDEDDGRGPR
ncbi:MAG: hypothetical protein OHK0013_28100 [Sandaracinaceae bacterium]